MTLGPWGWPFSCLPNPVADCRESDDYILSTCLDQFCWDVVDSSCLPFLQWLYCDLHFSAKDGVVILCVCLGTVQYWRISIGLVIVQFRAIFCPSVQYLLFFYETFSWAILESSSFPLFHSVFHSFLAVQGDWNAKIAKDAFNNWQGICGPFCNDNTNAGGEVWSLPPLMILCWWMLWSSQSFQKMDGATTTILIIF